MEKYTPKEYLKMLPQDAVKASFIDAPGYNAAWDYHITPDGRHFIPACAEGTSPEYVKLYEYIPATGEMKLCFELDKSICVYNRTIRPSKIHTSMNDLPDGRLIMTTHTTANAPTHPDWMPEAYHSNLWEGFAGSNVLIYDPNTGKVEDLGIPVPRESIYGARYIPELNALIMGGYLRGHLYLFTLDDRNVIDYGQCQEFGVYNISRGPDGNYYFATRTGELWKYDVAQRRPYYTGIDIPSETPDIPNWHVMGYAVNGPDGKMYFVSHLDSYFYVYDPAANTLEQLCHTAPDGAFEDYPKGMVFGLAFDRENKLWYSCDFGRIHLCRVDILNPEARPENFGLIATEKRCCLCAENTYICDDIAYISDTNYYRDLPGIYTVNLQKLREAGPICDDESDGRLLCQDIALFYKGKEPINTEFYNGDLESDSEEYFSIHRHDAGFGEALKINRFRFGEKSRYVTKIWKRFPICESQVHSIAYDPAGNVKAYIAANGGTCVTIRDGKVLGCAPSALPEKDPEAIAKRFEHLTLPCHPGRQYLAVASACAELGDGSILVGTKDGMAALVRGDKVFNLGSVVNGGAVHDIAVSADGTFAYGVAGDPDSLGMVFSYSAESGITLEGYLHYNQYEADKMFGVSCEPCSVAISPDGTRVAVGVRDQLGCVYEVEI